VYVCMCIYILSDDASSKLFFIAKLCLRTHRTRQDKNNDYNAKKVGSHSPRWERRLSLSSKTKNIQLDEYHPLQSYHLLCSKKCMNIKASNTPTHCSRTYISITKKYYHTSTPIWSCTFLEMLRSTFSLWKISSVKGFVKISASWSWVGA